MTRSAYPASPDRALVAQGAPDGSVRVFGGTSGQVQAARQFVREHLAGHPAVDDAVVVASELVTNSIVHSASSRPGGQFLVHAVVTEDREVGLIVTDEGGPFRPARTLPGQSDESGRGLVVVRSLTSLFRICDHNNGHRSFIAVITAAPGTGESTPELYAGRPDMHDLVVSPFLGEYLIVRPGDGRGLKISKAKYEELRGALALPPWLADLSRTIWNAKPGPVLVRPESALGYGKATYELNLGCNYDCEHCYLGLKKFDGLEWPDRERLLEHIRDAGVLWLQLTGGEPMIDRLFGAVYAKAHELGMMIEILTNGSRLADHRILDLLTERRPSRVIVSVYGASQETYDGLTRRKGAFRTFIRAMNAASDAGVRLDLSLIITARNAHEKEQMHDLARQYGRISGEYGTISPTIHGGAETLPSQSPQYLTTRKPFTGCAAGHSSFHVDPFGQASICKIGREPSIDLLAEGTAGLARLGQIADHLLSRQGGCTDCSLQATCGTCMPLVQLYRKARAPLAAYCQHQ